MNPPSATPVVALVDPLWIGHHPMYFTQFAASFLRNGARVIGLCPQPEQARAALASAGGETERAAWAERCHFSELATGGRSFFNGRFEGDPLRSFLRWRHAATALAHAEAASGWRADLVYFPYLDSYLRFLPAAAVPALTINRPWSGLYLRNHHHGEPASLKQKLRLLCKGDSLIRSALCRGIGVLDERFIPRMETVCRTTVSAFPDVTQTDQPASPTPLAREVIRKSAGRVIVGMIGLEKRKGFLTLIRTARLAAEKNLPLYFVCGGALHCGEFTATEWEEVASAARDLENLHLDPSAGRIPSEADFNDLFRTFGIAWAAYENFHGSSGTLGKAAHFGIPCLATVGECIGARVEKYAMGRVIHPLVPENALTGLVSLLEHPPENPRYDLYRVDHSTARLDALLAALLPSSEQFPDPTRKK